MQSAVIGPRPHSGMYMHFLLQVNYSRKLFEIVVHARYGAMRFALDITNAGAN